MRSDDNSNCRPLDMKILGIETSGRSGSIAFLNDRGEIIERELSATGRRHARTLVPEIGQLMHDQGLSLKELDGIAVSVGPGSFTGLRVGVVCAKTLAYALQKPLIAVDTFEAVAQACNSTVQRIWVIDDALRGDVYAASYEKSGEELLCSRRAQLVSLDSFLAQVSDNDIVSGPAVVKLKDDLPDLHFADEELLQPRAQEIARIGYERIANGQLDDHWKVEPHYIRRSAAEEKADAKAADAVSSTRNSPEAKSGPSA